MEEGAPTLKLYLTRGSRQPRQMQGRADAERLLESRGFTVVNPATLSFVEQLRLLRRASTVALQAGSAVFSLIYCRPGARIGYFPTDPTPELECIHEVLSRLGHKMLALAPQAGSTVEHPIADFNSLVRLLDELEVM